MKKVLLCIGMIAVLGGGCEKSTQPIGTSGKLTHVQGIVADRDGPVLEGQILVTDKTGGTLTTLNLKGSANYTLDLPPNTAYPVVLSLKAADELLEAVIIDSSVEQQDLTHMSSLVVRSARDLGGISKGNMAKAAKNAIAQSRTSNASTTSAGFKGDPTKQYGGWH